MNWVEEILAASRSPRADLRYCVPCKDKLLSSPRHAGACSGIAADAVSCPVHKLIVTHAICVRCRSDATSRARLFADYVRNRAARFGACRHRAQELPAVTLRHTGLERTISIAAFVCGKRNESACEPDCWLCSLYQTEEAP